MYVSQGPGGMLKTLGEPGSEEITRQRLRPGTAKRIMRYLRPHRTDLVFLILTIVIDSTIIVSTPLLLKELIDSGIMRQDSDLITKIALVVAGLSAVDAVAQLGLSYFSARIGQGVSFDLRIQAFLHVQRQPIGFFTRSQTGSLVSRLNTDVVGAQQAFVTLLMGVSSILITALVLVEMFYLSWAISVIALVVLPIFLVPGTIIGRKLQRYSREQMQVNAEMGATINERFNVAGAMLAKLFGRPQAEAALFIRRAERVRDIGVAWSVYSRLTFILMALLASIVTAVVYGLGGRLVLDGTFAIGTLVALAALLGRLYGPITQLSALQTNALTTLVGFDRIFEILDLEPLIKEKPDAIPLVRGDGPAPEIRFEGVTFRYPRASEVSLPSLESSVASTGEREAESAEVLQGVTFRAPSGKLTALVGPSGAGKTTITHLVSRLYDPNSGTVRIDGHDLRDVTLDSVRETIGVVTQDAHLFHDTIRANLLYAKPEALEQDLIAACEAAQIWDTIRSLQSGLDTVVGDRGYRLSGGEKQRIALARLLLKAPSIVVLDEATAHLDSESEAAIQRALKIALEGRTSVVIAHRLSTIREADQILVVADGRVKEVGTHEELLMARGLYAELYETQFAHQATSGYRGEPVVEDEPEPEMMMFKTPGGVTSVPYRADLAQGGGAVVMGDGPR